VLYVFGGIVLTIDRRRACALAVPLLVVAWLAAGCASPPKEPASLSCTQLDAEIGGTEQARRLALEKQQDPWKFVIPFSAGGTNVSAKSAVGNADKWLTELHEVSRTKGCARPG
jgi:hypothetical protein